MVQPVPAPCSTNALANNSTNDGGSSQKLMLLSRGKAISVIAYLVFKLVALQLHASLDYIMQLKTTAM